MKIVFNNNALLLTALVILAEYKNFRVMLAITVSHVSIKAEQQVRCGDDVITCQSKRGVKVLLLISVN